MLNRQVELTVEKLDEVLAPIGLSYFDLRFALVFEGELTGIWLHEALVHLKKEIGTDKFVILDGEDRW